jgi:hypothetical protein
MDETTPGSDVAALDELLQILFWLRGEGLAGDADSSLLARFTGIAESRIGGLLERLAALQLVQPTGAGRYALTEAGAREGGRRFADEFAPLLGQGHGECHDPDCDCHSDPAAAAECHARRPGGGHS